MQEQIHQLLNESLQPVHLSVENDSHLHAGPRTDSHFKVLIVSDEFINLNSVKRHQKVYKILNQVMQKIHALQLNTYTQEEWQQRHLQGNEKIPSSQCAKP